MRRALVLRRTLIRARAHRAPPTPLLPLLCAVLGLAGGGPARAEDFSGFYAGVNAGYGWSRDHGPSADGPHRGPPPATGLGRASPDLPPSAASAAAAMRRGTGRADIR